MAPLFEHARAVRFQDIDAAGILFYGRVFEYFHDAYFALLEARGIDMPRVLRERTYGAPLGHTEADFAAPMRYGDSVVVAVERVELGARSVTVHFRVRDAADPTRSYCTGKSVHVFIDRDSFRPIGVPDDVRAAFGAA